MVLINSSLSHFYFNECFLHGSFFSPKGIEILHHCHHLPKCGIWAEFLRFYLVHLKMPWNLTLHVPCGFGFTILKLLNRLDPFTYFSLLILVLWNGLWISSLGWHCKRRRIRCPKASETSYLIAFKCGWRGYLSYDVDGMQRLLGALDAFCQSSGLTVNVDKTKMMVVWTIQSHQ